MPVKKLFTDDQERRIRNLYIKEDRRPAEIAAIINAENGTTATPRQISEWVSTRDLGFRKKKLRVAGEQKASHLIASIATQIASARVAAMEKHKDFLETSVRIGGKVMKKAEAIIDATGNARDLSAAAGAAAKGIDIYRKSVGLDEPGSGGQAASSTNMFFNFARSEDSPFTPKPVDQVEVPEADAEVILDKSSQDANALPQVPAHQHSS